MDFISDNNPRGWFKLTAADSMPDYVVKAATFPSAEEVAKLHDTAFADPIKREHPAHNKVATFLTAAYLHVMSDVPQAVLENIKAAAELHGNSADVLPLLEPLLQQNTKQASELYALDVESGHFYPMRSVDDLTESVLGLSRDLAEGRLPVKLARQASRAMVKRAEELGLTSLPENVRHVGEETVLDIEGVKRASEWRARLALDEQSGQLYKEAVSVFEHDPSESTRQICAETWEMLDKASQIKISSLTPSAADIWFSGISEKTIAKQAQECLLLRDQVIPAAVITSVPVDVLCSWLPKAAKESLEAIHKAASSDTLEASCMLEALGDGQLQQLASCLTAYHTA